VTVPDPVAKIATMTWEQFAEARKRTSRINRYQPFVLGMRIKVVYDATGTFPKIKPDTLRSALYGQAKKLGRKIAVLIRDDKVYVTLLEAPTGKEK
jgi:hypothetical protein